MEDTKTPEAPRGLVARCMSYFGKKENQTLLSFKEEFNKLTDKDRQDLVDMFNAAGMPTVLTIG